MFMRITRTQVDSSRFDEVMAMGKDVIAAAKTLPGFQSAYIGGDRSSGRGAIVTIWDTREHAQFDRAAVGDVVTRAQDLGVRMEAPEIFELSE